MSQKLSRARHARSVEGAADASHASQAARSPEIASGASEEAPLQGGQATRDTVPAARSIGSSAALISICTIISRITGFIRTWAMAFALGSTMLSSSYQVANNLPSMLYELVVGGMLVTAFLPVYLSVKKRLGAEAGNAYASNLFTIVLVFLGLMSVLCIAFPAQVVYTQSFFSDQGDMADAVFFFQIFAIQIVFYGLSSILSGLLNANRDYLWSSIAPVANNVIVIASFLAFALIAPSNYTLALWIIAVGNPLGVFAQMIMQWPALKRNGIKLRLRIDLKDPALAETLRIGLPAVFVMVCSFAVVSVQNAAAYAFADEGPSIIAYARLWYTLPYSFLAVPITTAMFTELSDMYSEADLEGVKRGIISGTNQIMFLMIPFAMYLMVFAAPLVTLYQAGAFTADAVASISSYLCALALSLPIYGVHTYLQKAFSSVRRMGVFALINLFNSALQAALVIVAAVTRVLPIESIAWTSIVFYGLGDVVMFAYLRARFGAFGFSSTVRTCAKAIALGALGAVAGGAVLGALNAFVAPYAGSIPLSFAYIVCGGLTCLLVTFGLSYRLKVEEAGFVNALISKFVRKLKRS